MVLMIGFILYVNLSHRNPPVEIRPEIKVMVEGEVAEVVFAIFQTAIDGKNEIHVHVRLPSRQPRKIPRLKRLLKAMKENNE
jgi:hypothetical protein